MKRKPMEVNPFVSLDTLTNAARQLGPMGYWSGYEVTQSWCEPNGSVLVVFAGQEPQSAKIHPVIDSLGKQLPKAANKLGSFSMHRIPRSGTRFSGGFERNDHDAIGIRPARHLSRWSPRQNRAEEQRLRSGAHAKAKTFAERNEARYSGPRSDIFV